MSTGVFTTSVPRPPAATPLRLIDRTDLVGKGAPDRTLESVTHIVFHHTATSRWTVPEKIRYRSSSGKYYDAPYHYLVYSDGLVVKTRPVSRVPVCVRGWNRQSVCIAGVGNWEEEDLTTNEFVEACVVLVSNLRRAFPSIICVVRHKDLASTVCPGRHFPFEKILQEVNRAQS